MRKEMRTNMDFANSFSRAADIKLEKYKKQKQHKHKIYILLRKVTLWHSIQGVPGTMISRTAR